MREIKFGAYIRRFINACRRASAGLSVTTVLGLVAGCGRFRERLDAHISLFMQKIALLSCRAALHWAVDSPETWSQLRAAEQQLMRSIEMQQRKIVFLSEFWWVKHGNDGD